MSTERLPSDAEVVPINSVKPHPMNPRIGNVNAIAESLRVNGQYKGILVHRPSMHIIAGNHTWKAAKRLGWTKISVVWSDVDDMEALQILLADNRSSDASLIDEEAVWALAKELSSLDGTGYTAEDLRPPEIPVEPLDPPIYTAPKPSPAPANTGPVQFRVGRAKGYVDRAAFEEWRAGLPKTNKAALETVLSLLGFDAPEPKAPQPRAAATSTAVRLADLHPYPGNPNQGDVGLLMELLRTHGQTRPIVVNKATMRILAGNHVALAAEQLGWEHVGVSFVDTDLEGERRIVLADNRTAQLAGYANDALGAAIAALGTDGIDGSGFTLEDLDDVVNGRSVKQQSGTTMEAKFILGPLNAKVKVRLIEALSLTRGQELAEVAAMIGLPPGKVAQAS